MGIRHQYQQNFKAQRILDFLKSFKNLNLGPTFIFLLIITLILIGTNVIFLLERLQQLENEKQQVTLTLSKSTMLESSSSMGEIVLQMPKTEELPLVIEECTKIFTKEKVEILSFNLERFGNESTDKLASLNYAVVRMKVQGSKEAINKGLNIIETLPERVIKVDEAILDRNRGEFLFRIYYQEPNNPSFP